MDLRKQFLAGEHNIENIYSKSNLHPICVEAAIQFDKCNTKSSLFGSTTLTLSKTQYRISFDARNDMLNKKADGDQMMQRKKRVVLKYTDEARGMYSIACPKVDGDTKG